MKAKLSKLPRNVKRRKIRRLERKISDLQDEQYQYSRFEEIDEEIYLLLKQIEKLKAKKS